MFYDTSLRSSLSNCRTRDGVAEMLHREAMKEKSIRAMSLVFNRPVRDRYAIRKLTHFAARIDRRCVGRRFYKFDRSERMTGTLVKEFGRGYGKYHLHGIVSVANEHAYCFQKLAIDQWRTVTHHGTAEVKVLDDVQGWIDYSLKYFDENDESPFICFEMLDKYTK